MDKSNYGTILPLLSLAVSHIVFADSYWQSLILTFALVPIFRYLKLNPIDVVVYSLAMIVAASESIIFSGWKDANLFANYSLFFLLAGSMLILLEGTARKEPIRKDSDGKN